MALRAAVYGSCHAKALRMTLESLPGIEGAIEFAQMRSPLVMTPAEREHFETHIAPRLDLLIYQPLSAGARGPRFSAASILERVPESCVCLSFQYMHFELYTPFVNLPGHHLAPSPFDYLDFALVGAYLDGLAPEPAAQLAMSAVLTPTDVAALERWALAELRRRESSEVGPVNFSATDFIAENFRRSRLFHTVNHPAGEVFGHLAGRIAERLVEFGVLPGEAVSATGSVTPSEPLGRIRSPCLPQVHRAAALRFPDPADGLLHHRGRVFTPLECARRTFDYLRSKPRADVVEAFDRLAAKRPWFDSIRVGNSHSAARA